MKLAGQFFLERESLSFCSKIWLGSCRQPNITTLSREYFSSDAEFSNTAMPRTQTHLVLC
jgi:hypothetical protein